MIMDTYKVWGVCSANVQRSPTFEVVLNYALHETPQLARYSTQPMEIGSAGINVEDILANKHPLHRMIVILDAGLHYGIIREDINDVTQQMVDRYAENVASRGASLSVPSEDTAIMEELCAEVRPVLHQLLVDYRSKALKQAGIPQSFIQRVGMYKPMPAIPLDLVLAMDRPVLDKIKATRANMPRLGVVTTYADLVGQPPLEDDLKEGLAGATRQVAYFMDTRHKALEEMFKLISPFP